MPFSMFCAGNSGFHLNYSRIPVLGDVYDIQTAMGRLTTAGTQGIRQAVQGAVQDAIRDEMQPDAEADDDVEHEMRRYDRESGLYYFRQGVELATSRMISVGIDLDARNPGILWNDTATATSIVYSSDPYPAEILLHQIDPALTATGLNCAGVLGHIGTALADFAAWPGTPYGRDVSARFLINISLAKL